MDYTRRFMTLATVALLLVAMGGCAGGNDPAATGTPTPSSLAPTTTSPTTATTNAPPSDTQIASRAASALMRKYVTVVDRLRQDPKMPLSRLTSVATSVQLSAMEKLIKGERGKKLHQTGDTKVAELTVQSVNLDNSNPKSGKVPTVQIDVCVDVSHVDVLDSSGTSIVSRDRPDTGWTRYTVANYNYAAHPKGGWRVATGQDLDKTPCDAV
jgi:hypothetical protein